MTSLKIIGHIAADDAAAASRFANCGPPGFTDPLPAHGEHPSQAGAGAQAGA